jgi:hypothetical protein
MAHRCFRFCQMFQIYPTWSKMWKRMTSTQHSFRPTSSQVLSCYLKQCSEPPWTSYFVKYSSVIDDQRGWSHFNWPVGSSNYHVLRTGCYPYIKYHCSRRPHQDLTLEDKFFRFIKVINLGKGNSLKRELGTSLCERNWGQFSREIMQCWGVSVCILCLSNNLWTDRTINSH